MSIIEIMAQGKLDPKSIPNDGLTTRQRRVIPTTVVHMGPGKGRSTVAFGMAMRAWNQGMNISVFQSVKSAKWKVGEKAVMRRLGELHDDTGKSGPVEWHKMGEGWSWLRKQDTEEDHAAVTAGGWQKIKRRLEDEVHGFYIFDEFTYPIKWGWIDVDDVVETLKNRPGRQHVVMTGHDAGPKLAEVADPATEMTKVKHPMDVERKGQKGIEW